MKLKLTLLASLLCVSTVFAAGIVFTPEFNSEQEELPSGQPDLILTMRNGQWIKHISLPKTAKSGDKITIRNDADYESTISTHNIDIPLDKLTLKKGQQLQFKFSAVQQQWHYQVEQSVQVQPVLSLGQALVNSVQITSSNWLDRIRLPYIAADGALLKISSEAEQVSSIDPDGLLFASSFKLKRGDVQWFRYYQALNKWVPESIQARQVNVQQIGQVMTSVDAAVTQVNFSDGNWVTDFTLPATAQDRDRIVVSSTASWPAKINNRHIQTQASLTLKQGDRYEFVFIADQGQWVLLSFPVDYINAQELKNSQLNAQYYPLSQLELSSQSWRPEIKLPRKAQIDDKIVVKSHANQSTFISSANGLSSFLRPGETQRYVYTAKGWAVDSYTLDVLMVLHPDVVNQLGESAAKLRLLAAMELTNLTAQNSHAQFYIRQAGVMISAVPGTTMSKTLSNILHSTAIKNERERVAADMVYYESLGPDPDYCGLAFSSVKPVAQYMAAMGIHSCGISVMRHELGHNLGLQHDYDEMVTVHRGFRHVLGSTAMGGNTLNYYSSPKLYSPHYAVRLGEEGRIDAVSLLNKNAPIIAKFRSAAPV